MTAQKRGGTVRTELVALMLRRYGRHMLAVSRTARARGRAFAFSFSFLVGGIAILAACSSDDGTKAATCVDSKCAPGNSCLPLNGEVKCRKTCSSNDTPATSCPFGYTCVDTKTGVAPFCVQSTALRDDGTPLQKREGQWGAPCQPNLGMENPGCDGEQHFYCYGTSPTDGASYCTRYDCEKDSDCGAGFWCGKINKQPNVQTTKRGTIGDVVNVCLRREFCATCAVDLDCPAIAGKKQHCVGDNNGQGYCSPECVASSECPNEARCADLGLGGPKGCVARAGLCVGDGSLCSPCRVDTDCGEDGACVRGQYTTEKSCAKKSTASCGDSKNPSRGSCPQKLESPAVGIGCFGFALEQVPKDYCHGYYRIGPASENGGDIGCWTPARK